MRNVSNCWKSKYVADLAEMVFVNFAVFADANTRPCAELPCCKLINAFQFGMFWGDQPRLQKRGSCWVKETKGHCN